MWQRKQTVFLILAVVFCILCLSLPIATWMPQQLGTGSVVYNLGISNGDGTFSLKTLPLFIILTLSATLAVVTIFLFKNRKLQKNLCSINIFLIVIWYIVFAAIGQPDTKSLEMRVGYAACFPMAAVIFYFLARHGIVADEKLVRSTEHFR